MQGIYKIINNITNKVYIGQSVNISERWASHRREYNNPKSGQYTSKFYKAIREYGIENFTFEILEQVDDFSKLNDREIFWIAEYNSYKDGYNGTPGGTNVQGENNPRALLSKEDVEEIRECYASHIPFRKVLERYEGKISKRGLQKIWSFETWLDVKPEVYTQKNREWHATASKGFCQQGIGDNDERCIKQDEINYFLELRAKGLSYRKIGEITGHAMSTVRKYCLNPQDTSQKMTVRNINTLKEFRTQKAAYEWSNGTKWHMQKALQDPNHSCGFVPGTNKPAFFEKIS